VTLAHVVKEGQEALAPFRFRAPAREGRYSVAVSFRHALSGERIRLEGEISVETGASPSADGAVPLYQRIQRAVYLKTLMD